MTQFSWTGLSRTPAVKQKLIFRSLTAVLALVTTIMHNCDNRWISEDTDKLFKEKLLKHAKQRNAAYDKKKKTPSDSFTELKKTYFQHKFFRDN